MESTGITILDILTFGLEVVGFGATVWGLIFAGQQLKQTNEHLKLIKTNREKQYDQARREKTSNIVTYYTERVNPQTKYIEKIVANLDDDQCIDLYNCTPFVVDDNTHKKLCSICPNKGECNRKKPLCRSKDGKYYVKDDLLYCLRGNIVNYLNTLESVLLTWELGIVERSIIEEQFTFLDKKMQKERALETFRSIAGNGKSYPSIEKFYQFLHRKAQEESKESLKDIIN